MQDAFYGPLNCLKQHGKLIHTVGFLLLHFKTGFFLKIKLLKLAIQEYNFLNAFLIGE